MKRFSIDRVGRMICEEADSSAQPQTVDDDSERGLGLLHITPRCSECGLQRAQ